MFLLAIYKLSLVKYLFQSSVHFLTELFDFFDTEFNIECMSYSH